MFGLQARYVKRPRQVDAELNSVHAVDRRPMRVPVFDEDPILVHPRELLDGSRHRRGSLCIVCRWDQFKSLIDTSDFDCRSLHAHPRVVVMPPPRLVGDGPEIAFDPGGSEQGVAEVSS